MENRRETRTFQVESCQEGDRVDRWLTQACPDLSRSAIKKLIDSEDVLVDDRPIRSSYRVSVGECVSLRVPDPKALDILAEDIPLDIRYEDDYLLVVNKAAGMIVHPSGPLRTGTLVNALLGHARLSSVNGELRPGIVHRLDKNTSGLLVVAKDDVTHRGLAGQIEAKEIQRQYLALCWGHLDENGNRIETMIDRHRRDRIKMAVTREGRRAVTHYRVTARYDFLSLLEVTLETGRTHQIRVHLDYIGHPVFGDAIYNGGEKRLKGISPLYRSDAARLLKRVDRQMLHAQRLAFKHPDTGKEFSFESDPPNDFATVLQLLEEENS